MYSLYKTIKDLCDANGISIAKMSRDINIHRNVMGNLKAGRTKSLALETLEKIASYFNVPLTYLLDVGDIDEKDIPPVQTMDDDMLMFALWKNPSNMTKEDLNRVRSFAHYLEQERQKGEKDES